jgi:broad specificity phosphatase PhoE
VSFLILIKHSLPEIQEGIAPNLWHLSQEGKRRAHLLAPRLAGYGLQRVFASLEPKASETGEILAADLRLPFRTVANLHEHVRPAAENFSQAAFEADVANFFARPDALVFGRETADQAHARFRAAVMGILEETVGQSLAVVAHGTVISLFVSREFGVEPFPLWKSLGLPSCVVLDITHFPQIKQID